MKTLATIAALALLSSLLATPATEPKPATPDDVQSALKDFFAKTAKPDGSFRPGIDPKYEGMSDADACFFHVGTLVMAGWLKPTDPLPKDSHLLGWGHLFPVK